MSQQPRRATCPGSFDPVTLGHLDIIGRTSALFDEVVVAVGANPGKNALFSPAERMELLEAACRPWPNVSVSSFAGLLVDFCTERDIAVVVKGLRFVSDFDSELQMAQMNSSLSGVETVFMPTDAQWAYVSSSLVREVALLGGDVTPFVPEGISERIVARARERARG